jgi:hypothetical protein
VGTLLGGEALELVLKVGSSRKLDPTLFSTSLVTFLHKVIKTPLS